MAKTHKPQKVTMTIPVFSMNVDDEFDHENRVEFLRLLLKDLEDPGGRQHYEETLEIKIEFEDTEMKKEYVQ